MIGARTCCVTSHQGTWQSGQDSLSCCQRWWKALEEDKIHMGKEQLCFWQSAASLRWWEAVQLDSKCHLGEQRFYLIRESVAGLHHTLRFSNRWSSAQKLTNIPIRMANEYICVGVCVQQMFSAFIFIWTNKHTKLPKLFGFGGSKTNQMLNTEAGNLQEPKLLSRQTKHTDKNCRSRQDQNPKNKEEMQMTKVRTSLYGTGRKQMQVKATNADDLTSERGKPHWLNTQERED